MSPSESDDSYGSVESPRGPPLEHQNQMQGLQQAGGATAQPLIRQRLNNGQHAGANSFMDLTNDDRHLYSLSNQQAIARPSIFSNQQLPPPQQQQIFTFNQNPLNSSYQYRSVFAKQQAGFAAAGVASSSRTFLN